MGIKFVLPGDVVTMEVNLEEFMTIVGQLSGDAMHSDVRKALATMTAEVRKSYDTLVDVLAPLYALTDEESFGAQFPAIRSKFKGTYLKERGTFRTHCDIVSAQLEVLKQKKEWLSHIPRVSRRVEELDLLANGWITSDGWLAYCMDAFLDSVDEWLDDIAQVTNSHEGFAGLSESLGQMKDWFLSIKGKLDELALLASKL